MADLDHITPAAHLGSVSPWKRALILGAILAHAIVLGSALMVVQPVQRVETGGCAMIEVGEHPLLIVSVQAEDVVRWASTEDADRALRARSLARIGQDQDAEPGDMTNYVPVKWAPGLGFIKRS